MNTITASEAGFLIPQVLIPKYGLEGTLFLRSTSKTATNLDWVFDEEEPSQTCGPIKLTLFMKLTVQVHCSGHWTPLDTTGHWTRRAISEKRPKKLQRTAFAVLKARSGSGLKCLRIQD